MNPASTESKLGLDVYCRLRPTSNRHEFVKVLPPCKLVAPPSNGQQLRNPTAAHQVRETIYTFKKVFDEKVGQSEIFETVALPLLENLLNGGSGLLFTYGVTGSGKTFTMNGSSAEPGIMPRCIETIFNSLSPYLAEKYIFKPDKFNGFDIQGEADALAERQQEFLVQLTPSKNRNAKLEKMKNDSDPKRVSCQHKLSNICEDYLYSVFVTCVEIYNNQVFDLLEENPSNFRAPQNKIIREDGYKRMFAFGVNEVEVRSAEEAYQVFTTAQKRKKIAHTALNAESSRAHTVFTIKVAQTPSNEHGQVVLDKKYLSVGHLSLVDLAGSERAKRTDNTGQRLREAGNINNSLMALRSCFEALRENQKGGNKIVPYRHSKLTHLFKSYFEGEGLVKMVVCVNPSAEDLEENLQVLSFAEMSQEVQISMTPKAPHRIHMGLSTPGLKTPSVRRALVKRLEYDEGNKENGGSRYIGDLNGLFADIPIATPENEDFNLRESVSYLEKQLKFFETFERNLSEREHKIKNGVLKLEKTCYEADKYRVLYEREREKVTTLENKTRTNDLQMSSLKRKVDEYEMNVKKLKRELSDKDLMIKKNKIDSSKVREQFDNKMAETEEKLKGEMEKKLRCQKSALEFELRSKERKLREAHRVLSDERPATSEEEGLFRRPMGGLPSTPLCRGRPPSPNFRSTSRKLTVARKLRRSRSAERWLEHKPTTATDLGTVLRPVMSRRRSVSRLTDAKELTAGGADRYCLITQGLDSDGDFEARIYKGDIVGTTGGGAQVQFSDVEILKQKSPTAVRRQARGGTEDLARQAAPEPPPHRRWL